ncbi:kelch repeat and BTB domain-containing protein 3 [Trichonephila clavata]|uniref:Kelch repeat and BTB domain-containing protein 3 n=1 Tax=Trichonephila clavata TaxID=2740835 RepID=A0A8X6GSA0_TRICU|nr:kelch repeat and BTB domain-containing protein 3 [Trichonephila clavata]
MKSEKLNENESLQHNLLPHLYDGYVQTDDGKLLPVHRILMSLISPFFHTAFVTEGMKHGSNICKVSGIKSEILQLIINFTMDEKIVITDENIQDLIFASDYLEIKKLLGKCCDYIRFNSSLKNCISLYQSSLSLDHLELTKHCYRFIEIHFEKLVNQNSFLNVSFDILERILESDDLNVSRESTIWEAIYSWIKANEETRIGRLHQLLSHLRLSQHEISNIVNKLGNGTIRNFLLSKKKLITSNKSKRPHPSRKCYIIVNYIANKCVGSITYDEKIDFIRNLFDIPIRPTSVASDSNGNVYLIQGVRCWSYCLEQNTLESLPDLEIFREDYGMVVMDGFLYIIGGVVRRPSYMLLRTVERFNSITRRWSWVQSLQFPSKGPATTLKGKIYVLSQRIHSQIKNGIIYVERYNPSYNSWALMPHIPNLEIPFSIMTHNDRIVVLGQRNNELILLTFDPKRKVWYTWRKTLRYVFLNPKTFIFHSSFVIYEASDEVENPKTFIWDMLKKKWIVATDPFLKNPRHYNIFCIDSLRAVRILCDRSLYEWEKLSLV